MTVIAIARRRSRVTLEAPIETPDALGGVIRSFAPRATLWAALEPLSGGETAEADQPLGRAKYRVRLRWRNDVTAGMRIRAGARWLDIETVQDPDGRRREIWCLCVEAGPEPVS